MTRRKPPSLGPLFDVPAAIEERDRVLRNLERTHSRWIDRARFAAKRIARLTGTVIADDVRRWAIEADDAPDNWKTLGAVFTSAEFVWTGERMVSGIKKGHGNEQRVWRLR
jgi:hypothetical protein